MKEDFFTQKNTQQKLIKKIKKTTIQTIRKNQEDKKIKEQKENNAFCYLDL